MALHCCWHLPSGQNAPPRPAARGDLGLAQLATQLGLVVTQLQVAPLWLPLRRQHCEDQPPLPKGRVGLTDQQERMP